LAPRPPRRRLVSDGDGRGRPPMRGMARTQFRRGSVMAEHAGARIIRGLGEPAIFAIMMTGVVSGLFITVGIVAEGALGLTPVVFGIAALFFVTTILTYVEGSSLHTERGGASTFARYAFNELWSFIAGWAIILDYLIVMAIASIAITKYLTAFWGETDDAALQIALIAVSFAFVAWQNIRGLSAETINFVRQTSLVGVVVLAGVSVIALAQSFDPGAITDSIELGTAPTWQDAFFAIGIACVSAVAIEAASGLAGEVRVGRRGLKRVVIVTTAIGVVLMVLVSVAALMAVPVVDGKTELGSRWLEAPLLGVVSTFDPEGLETTARIVVGASGAGLLLATMNAQMLGLARLGYSLATNRQIPSAAGRLHSRRGTPHVVIGVAALIGFGLALSRDVEFLAGVFAFGAMVTFAIAHLSIVVLRFREADRPSAFRMPLAIPVKGGSIPIPAAAGALLAIAVWLSVVILHDGGRIIGGVWMAVGIALYVIYRRSSGRPMTKRFTIPAAALQEAPEREYGSILVPVFGEDIDDDIVGTAGRLAAEHPDEDEGGAVLEALYIFEIPMSLPIDARVPEERVKEAKRVLARAKEVGEEYEGVEVATAMVRGRSAGQAIVFEAKRRGVEAIVLAAEEPTRTKGGGRLGGRARTRDRFVGETTRYVVEKASCAVILTAPPANGEGIRGGVQP
ncbi:MAG: amino acid permease, partial [Thermoleophilaceae bacterium]